MTAYPKDEMWTVFKRLLAYLKPMKGMFLLSVAGLIVYGLVDAAFISFIGPFIDKGFSSSTPAITNGIALPTNQGFHADNQVLLMAPIVVILMFSLRGFANFVSTYGISYMSARLIMDMRQQVFQHYLSLPVSYMDKENTGNLISKVTFDTEQIARASGSALISIVRDGVTVIGMLGLMFYNSWKLSLCILVIGPIMGLVMTIVSRRFRKVSKQIQTAMGDVSAATEQMIKGHKNVLAFGGQETETARFAKINDRNRHQNMKLAIAQAISQPLIMVIGSFDAEFQRGIAACTTVFELLDTLPESDTGTYTVKRAKGNLRFDNVSFSYEGQERRALDKIDFEVSQGQTLALVGRSGSGKSTIASLVTRFYTGLASGDILLDDVSIYDYSLKSLRSQVALVSQQVTLFNDTIANNIAYAYPGEVTREQIIEAATLAHAMEFIEQLPDGLDTQVGENGVLLSGGQRQRIAIARAMLRDAPVLILDEATSALDTESEKAIQQGLDNLRQNRTSVVIAHRLSTIESADQILVVDQGRIVERGTHKSLLELGGMYAKLYQMQFGS